MQISSTYLLPQHLLNKIGGGARRLAWKLSGLQSGVLNRYEEEGPDLSNVKGEVRLLFFILSAPLLSPLSQPCTSPAMPAPLL